MITLFNKNKTNELRPKLHFDLSRLAHFFSLLVKFHVGGPHNYNKFLLILFLSSMLLLIYVPCFTLSFVTHSAASIHCHILLLIFQSLDKETKATMFIYLLI